MQGTVATFDDQTGAGTQPGEGLGWTEVDDIDGVGAWNMAHVAIIGQRLADRSFDPRRQEIRRRVEVAEAHPRQAHRMHAELLLQALHRVVAGSNGRCRGLARHTSILGA